ncbi:hypothetical protein AAG906_036482 [Vitis piasezkii]
MNISSSRSSISEEKDFPVQGSWIPVTPVKPILPITQPQICAGREHSQLYLESSSGSERFPPTFPQETQAHKVVACENFRNCAELNSFSSWNAVPGAEMGVRNYNAGIYRKPSFNLEMGLDNIPFTQLLAQTNAAFIPSAVSPENVSGASSPFMSATHLHPEVSSSTSMLLKSQDLLLGSSQWTSAPDMNQYGLPAYRHFYDLNSPPESMAEAVSGSAISHFAPITPDKNRRVENSWVAISQNLCPEEKTVQETEKQEKAIDTTRVEVNHLHCDSKLLQSPTDLSFAPVSSPLNENANLDNGGNHAIGPLTENCNFDKRGDHIIDLNKTPQQKPRRKKHRPKVVIEGKPKRTPKPVNPKCTGSQGNPTGKRKYVRKNGVNKPSTNSPAEIMGQSTEPERPERTMMSCRRGLNFDDNGRARGGSSSCISTSDLNSEPQARDFCTQGIQSKSVVMLSKEMEVTVEETQVGIAYDLTRAMNQEMKNYMSLPDRQFPSTPPQRNTDHPWEKLKNDAQNENDRERASQEIVCDKQENILQESLKSMSPNNTNCSTGASLKEREHRRGTKRVHSHIVDKADARTMSMNGNQYNSVQAYHAKFQANEQNRNPGMHFPEIYKKKRTEKGLNSTATNLSPVMAAKNIVMLATACPQNHAIPSSSASKSDSWISASRFTNSSAPATRGQAENGGQDKVKTFDCMLALGPRERLTKKRSKGLTRVRDLASLNGIALCKLLPNFPDKRISPNPDVQGAQSSNRPHTCIEALVAETSKLARRKRTKKRNPVVGSTSSRTNEVQLHQQTDVYNNRQLLKLADPPELIWKHRLSIDTIIEQLKHLDIHRESKISYQEQNALVPYNMNKEEKNALVLYKRDGTIVPFEDSFGLVKKRRPRPRVDLDEETSRVWKLLMGNINSEGINGTDEEKAKWWEEERNVFRGRADSFIARMHLVQGDRRFSKWKGSVVDSVVGVFLTQNVSDHLSSSAFMSLAAHFPCKCNQRPSTELETRILVEEPEVCTLNPEDTVTWNEKMSNQAVCDQSSMTLHHTEEAVNSNGSYGNSRGTVGTVDISKDKMLDSTGKKMSNKSSVNGTTTQMIGTELACFIGGDRTAADDAASSQNSLDFSIAQTAEKIGSCSESNSEVEDIMPTGYGLNNFDGSTSFVGLLQMAESTRLHEVFCRSNINATCGANPKDVNNHSESMSGYNKRSQNMDGLADCRSSLGVTIIPSSNYHLHLNPNSGVLEVEGFEMSGETRSSEISRDQKCVSEQSGLTAESDNQAKDEKKLTESIQAGPTSSCENTFSDNNLQGENNKIIESQSSPVGDPKNVVESVGQEQISRMQQSQNLMNISGKALDVTDSSSAFSNQTHIEDRKSETGVKEHGLSSSKASNEIGVDTSKAKKGKARREEKNTLHWDNLRKEAQVNGRKRERTVNTMDSLDWEAVRCADVNEIANTIKERGMNNMLAERIKDFLNRLVRDHGSIDLEWLRDVPPDKAKEYLLSFRGLGLKSVECVRLLTLHHLAFPVDTNVGRIAVRLGWVPLQPLPESLQLHLLELYPVLESIQKYLWPRLCKLDQRTLYELHYQMITFGKVFCTKSKPNCNACPMRGECRHFASAFASARLALTGPEERSIVSTNANESMDGNPDVTINPLPLPPPLPQKQSSEANPGINNCEPIVEVPATPEQEHPQILESDIEDTLYEDPDEIPTIKLNIEEFTHNLQNYMQRNMELQESDMSKALVALTPEVASIPMPKLKNVSRLRTEHHVYELPDSHPLLEGLDKREPDDPCSYLLAIWTPGETANSIQPPERKCSSQESGGLCDEKTCFSCNSIREANSQTVRGTLLIPCRTAMRGSFPLNGTYFQVNEVFADHDSSLNPIDVPRAWIWNLPRRTVYFGTSIPTIFKGLSTEDIQYCFWRGFVCVRGFDQKTRAPRPLMARLHFPASRLTRTKGKTNEN